jgi:hypothetical protein
MIGRRGIEVGTRGPALLGQHVGALGVEGRATDGHRHDPLAAGASGRLAAHDRLHVGDGSAAGERREDQLQALAVHVGVGVDQSWDDDGAAEVHDARGAIAPAAHVGPGADRGDAAVPHGERRRARAPGVECQETAVEENPVGRYFIHPFSRNARSAPGWSGMPTSSGFHAVFGSNSANPA